MNSGETRESKHHIAVLEEEDVETFTAFCEYAYTGDYVVPPPGQREDEKEQVVHNPFKGFLRGERDAMDAAKLAGSGAGMGMGTGVESVGSPAVSAEGFQGFQGWNGFLPPPAPSPPPPAGGYGPGPGPGGYGYGDGDGVNGLGLNAKSWEEMRAEIKVPEQAIDDGDDIEPFPAMPVAPETAPEKEDAKPAEQPEQPEPKQPEPEKPEKPAQQQEPTEDAPEGKSKKGKKNKKDKKKKGNTEEVPELTPPTTPPAKHTENPAESVGEPGPEVAEVGGQVASAEPTLAVETAGQMESKPESNQGKEEKREEKEVEEQEEEKKQDKPEPQEQQQQERQQAPPLPPQQQQQKQETFPLFTPRDQRIDMWDEFMTLEYVDQRPTYPTPRSKVAKACTPDDLPYLTFHAKVYVFATRYLIPALAQLSLQKLHRDLLYLAFPVDPDFSSAGAAGGQSSIPARADEEEEGQAELQKTKARMVLDLLCYTYSKTTRVELTIVPGCDLEREEGQEHQRPSELRKLVVHYAACRVRDLAMYGPVMNTPGTNHDRKPSSRGLRGLLDTMSELASDLVFRMM